MIKVPDAEAEMLSYKQLEDWKRQVRLVMQQLPASYTARYLCMQQLKQVFQETMALELRHSLNDWAKARDHLTDEEKASVFALISQNMQTLDLALASTTKGEPAKLLVSCDEDGVVFQFKVLNPRRKNQREEPRLRELPPLVPMFAPPTNMAWQVLMPGYKGPMGR